VVVIEDYKEIASLKRTIERLERFIYNAFLEEGISVRLQENGMICLDEPITVNLGSEKLIIECRDSLYANILRYLLDPENRDSFVDGNKLVFQLGMRFFKKIKQIYSNYQDAKPIAKAAYNYALQEIIEISKRHTNLALAKQATQKLKESKV